MNNKLLSLASLVYLLFPVYGYVPGVHASWGGQPDEIYYCNLSDKDAPQGYERRKCISSDDVTGNAFDEHRGKPFIEIGPAGFTITARLRHLKNAIRVEATNIEMDQAYYSEKDRVIYLSDVTHGENVDKHSTVKVMTRMVGNYSLRLDKRVKLYANVEAGDRLSGKALDTIASYGCKGAGALNVEKPGIYSQNNNIETCSLVVKAGDRDDKDNMLSTSVSVLVMSLKLQGGSYLDKKISNYSALVNYSVYSGDL